MAKRSSRPDVLQVEQLFDDGSHPAIADTLFAGEYKGEASASPTPPAHPVCPGQMTIADVEPARCPGAGLFLVNETKDYGHGYGFCPVCGVRIMRNGNGTAPDHDTPAAIIARHGLTAWKRAHRYHPNAGRLHPDGLPIFPLAIRTESHHHGQ